MSNIGGVSEKGAVRVIVRERPVRESMLEADGTPSAISYHQSCPNILVVADGRPFTFDKVLGPKASQEQLFHDILPLVDKVKQGYNCTALAYGQTGTGKSYSMGLNSNSSEGENMGIIPRCLLEILESDKGSSSSGNLIEICASFIEIYNEKVFDLLAENTTEPIISRGHKYTGGTRKIMKTMDDCYHVLQQANKNRHVRPTKMNAQSSRSHAIFTIHVNSVCEKGLLNTRLNLVDLAGSEGVRRTGHQGVAMSEGVNINQGLLSIGKVLQAKALGSKVIPYRDSILTFVLQDSLNERSFLTLLACISPHHEDLSETLSTLRFAQSVKQLKHSPHVNLILAQSKKNRTKTPKKTPAPVKRLSTKVGVQSGFKAVKPLYHSNTFCTPSKVKRNLLTDKLNRSELGLTPKQKEKDQTSLIPALATGHLSTRNSNLPLIRNRESGLLLDHSLDSRASILSINVSSSTVFGNEAAQVPSKFMSYSPVVRKCMAEIENVMENKIAQLIDTIKDFNKENLHQRTVAIEKPICSTPCPTDPAATATATTTAVDAAGVVTGSLPLALRQELKSIIQEVLNESIDPKLTDLGNAEHSNSTMLESSILRSDPKCQLFTTSSPFQFKVPIAPVRLSTQRRSRRLSQRLQNRTLNNSSLRRSVRLSTMAEQMEPPQPLGSSTGSSKTSCSAMLKGRRQSIRLATQVKRTDSDKENEINIRANNNKNSKGVKNVKRNIIESYFSNDSEASTSTNRSKKQNLQKHRQNLLDLLNSGTMKELQILPQIGPKRAFQLLTQRTLSGKFKNLAQLERLPIWPGKSWERFAQANLLID